MARFSTLKGKKRIDAADIQRGFGRFCWLLLQSWVLHGNTKSPVRSETTAWRRVGLKQNAHQLKCNSRTAFYDTRTSTAPSIHLSSSPLVNSYFSCCSRERSSINQAGKGYNYGSERDVTDQKAFCLITAVSARGECGWRSPHTWHCNTHYVTCKI
jgi:hypothetical protein